MIQYSIIILDYYIGSFSQVVCDEIDWMLRHSLHLMNKQALC